jgi:hypothetical protein
MSLRQVGIDGQGASARIIRSPTKPFAWREPVVKPSAAFRQSYPREREVRVDFDSPAEDGFRGSQILVPDLTDVRQTP